MKISPDQLDQSPRAFWEQSAPQFVRHAQGELNGDGSYIRNELLIPHMIELLGQVSGQHILDAGGGEGILSRKLKNLGARTSLNDHSYLLAHTAYHQETSTPSCVTDLECALPYAENSFDAVVNNLVLMWMPDIVNPAQEFFRVLKPGGRCVISVTHPLVNTGTFDQSDPEHPKLILEHSLQEGVFLKMINKTNGPYPYYQRTASAYLNTLINAGFQLLPNGFEDYYFPRAFVAQHPEYTKHVKFPLFLLIAVQKPR